MEGLPPFPVPQGKSGHWEQLSGPEVSDGDVRQWPGKPLYRPISETHYLISLATAWVKDQNLDQPHVNYYLDKLPDGYGLFETDRPGGDGQAYKRLFGHPTGRYYDSAKRFEVHFKWLMNLMDGDCECVLCSGKKPPAVRRSDAYRLDQKMLSRPGSRTQSREVAGLQREDSSGRSKSATGLASEREKRQPKTAEPALPVDEEGTEDVYRKHIQELYKFKHKKVKDEIVEKYSFDWKAERKSLPPHLSHISLQHSFIPRLGELVLWCPYFPDELDLVFNPATGFYQFYSFDQECFLGFPNWRGGVIAATPSSVAVDGPLDFPDILSNPRKQNAYNTSGFRVETFPDPNNDTNKSLSKQYKYVPLRQIRPLSYWQTLLRGIPERKLDPSFKYALTAMTAVSLLEKFRFVGDWPNASIHCKGVYLGAELIVVGDAVRILPTPIPTDSSTPTPAPPNQTRCTDILVISSIRLNLHDITHDHTLLASRTLSTTSSITLVGRAYTLDPRRDYSVAVDLINNPNLTHFALPAPIRLEDVKSAFPTVGAKHYGDWFLLHAPHLKYEISLDKVLGRLHEADAVRLWTGMAQNKASADIAGSAERRQQPSLSYDLDGVLSGRKYATQTDERIPSCPAGEVRWFWADTRVQALNVETFNGWEVGRYDLVRKERGTVRAWRAMLRVLDGTASSVDVKDTRLPQKKGRQKGARLVEGRVVYPSGGGGDGDGDGSEGGGIGGLKGKGRERVKGKIERGFSFGSLGGGGSQMLMAGLAQDESSDDEDGDGDGDEEDETTVGEEEEEQDEEEEEEEVGVGGSNGSGNENGNGNASGLDNRVEGATLSEGAGAGVGAGGEQRKHGHLARKNVRKGMRKGMGMRKMPVVPRSKMQIMASMEGGESDDDDDDDEDDDEDGGEDYDYNAVQDIVEGRMPLARGGTEESEGGDYNPQLDSFQSTPGVVAGVGVGVGAGTGGVRRRSTSRPGTGSGSREKRMKF